MTEQELVKGLTYLGTAYGKEYTQMECQQHYDFLKEYSYETFVAAIKNIIKKSKFLPKITELLEECENCKEGAVYEVLEFMRLRGYFKTPLEYDKATSFMAKGIVPEWLQKDINEYYKMMKQETLEHQETFVIVQEQQHLSY